MKSWGIVVRELVGVREKFWSPKVQYRLWGLLLHWAPGTYFLLRQGGRSVNLIALFLSEVTWMVFCLHFPRYLYSVVLHLVSTGIVAFVCFVFPVPTAADGSSCDPTHQASCFCSSWSWTTTTASVTTEPRSSMPTIALKSAVVTIYTACFNVTKYTFRHTVCLLGAFGKLGKVTVNFFLCVPPHGTTRLPLDGFSWNLMFEYFSKICGENSIVSLKSDKNNRYCTWRRVCTVILSGRILLRLRSVSDKSCIERERERALLYSITFIS